MEKPRFDLNLSVVIPAYNEEETLEKVTLSTIEALKRLVKDYELIIVNDGSIDNTREIAERLTANNEKIRVIHHPFNIGFGGSQKSGYTSAKFEYVTLVPADGQFPLSCLEKYLSEIDGVDIVMGQRMNRQDSLGRKFNSKIYHTILRRLFNLHFKDIAWVKLFKKDVLNHIPIETRGAFVEAEIVIKAHYLGYKIKEIKVPHAARIAGKAKGDSLIVILGTIFALFRLWYNLNFNKINKKIEKNGLP